MVNTKRTRKMDDSDPQMKNPDISLYLCARTEGLEMVEDSNMLIFVMSDLTDYFATSIYTYMMECWLPDLVSGMEQRGEEMDERWASDRHDSLRFVLHGMNMLGANPYYDQKRAEMRDHLAQLEADSNVED